MIKADNAVILAAGYSSRFVPICFDKPKALLPVRGETLVERQIRQLREAGIRDIAIVTGAYHEQFDFLKEKHQVCLIFNPDYQTKNNFSSFYAARDFLANTVITSSDLYFARNIFVSEAEHPYFVSIFAEGETAHRCLSLNKQGQIVGVKYGGKDCWITFGGHAFLSEEIGAKLTDAIEAVYNDPAYANSYWVDFQDQHIAEMPMYIKKILATDIWEFNTLESLWKFDPAFCAADVSKTMQNVLWQLDCKEERLLSDFVPVKANTKPIGFLFSYQGHSYSYSVQTNLVERLI